MGVEAVKVSSSISHCRTFKVEMIYSLTIVLFSVSAGHKVESLRSGDTKDRFTHEREV